MTEALRYNQDKMNWIILDGYFKDAQEAEYYCREYGIQKYTDAEKGIDGLTNWMSSMGTDKHDEFMYGCLESANRHLLALRRGEQVDPESGKLHVGFVRLNMGMYQAYWKCKESHKVKGNPCPHDEIENGICEDCGANLGLGLAHSLGYEWGVKQ